MKVRGLLIAVLLMTSAAPAWAGEAKHFHKWTVVCGTDSLTDNRTCSMDQRTEVAAYPKEALVSFSVYRGIKSDRLSVMVFSSSLMRSEPVHIRVDKNPAVSSRDYLKGNDAVTFPEAVVSQLSDGKKAFVRFTDRYSNIPYDADIDLEGFNEALSYLKSIKE